MTTHLARPGLLARAFAWTGGALFVLALVAGAYFYLLVLNASPTGGGPPGAAAVAINVALFALFAVHHSLLARDASKAWIAAHVPPYLERPLYVWVASLLFIGLCAWWQPIAGYAWRLEGGWSWAGRGAQVLGLVCSAIGARALNAFELAGIRQVRTAHGTSRPIDTAITTAGLYGWVRHPIYMGWVFMVLGTPDMTWGRFVFAAVSIAYLVVAIPWEERSLVGEFGQAYRDYQAQVRWRLVPGLY